MKNWKKAGISTRAIHMGNQPDPNTGSIIPPIHQTSTFVQSSPGKHQGYEYTRSHNPTRTHLEECLAGLENAKHALVTSSGMAAATLVMHSLPKGSLIISGDDVYGGTYRLFTTVFQNYHDFIFTDTTDYKSLQSLIKKRKPALIWLESPTNPLLKITDIERVCEMAKKQGSSVLVDNTFMSPYFQNPLDLGADIVLHSMTKYLNGHSDVVAGSLFTNKKSIYDKLWYLQNSTGPSQSPFDSWLVLRGLKTLGVRMKAHEENAFEVAKFLEKHKKVEKVIYPGLESHPHHQIALKQTRGHSGMVTFFIKGGLKASRKFLESLEVFALAESLGGVESLVDHPAIMTHASIPQKEREKLGITNNLIRLSVGIEDKEDIIKDLKNALKLS